MAETHINKPTENTVKSDNDKKISPKRSSLVENKQEFNQELHEISNQINLENEPLNNNNNNPQEPTNINSPNNKTTENATENSIPSLDSTQTDVSLESIDENIDQQPEITIQFTEPDNPPYTELWDNRPIHTSREENQIQSFNEIRENFTMDHSRKRPLRRDLSDLMSVALSVTKLTTEPVHADVRAIQRNLEHLQTSFDGSQSILRSRYTAENYKEMMLELDLTMQRCLQEDSKDESSLSTLEDNCDTPTTEEKERLESEETRERELMRVIAREERRMMKRLNIMDELIETEERYTSDLFVLSRNTKCISKEDQATLCRNEQNLCMDQELFCASLRKAVEYDKLGGTIIHIAECFIESKEYFESYFEYCIKQEEAFACYHRLLETNSRFFEMNDSMNFFARNAKENRKLKFEDYMIMPFQRLFRYKLLLQTLEKALPSNIEGHELLTEAKDVVHNVAKNINDAKAKIELEKKTDLFLSRLHTDWSLPKRWHKDLGTCSLIGTLDVRLPKQKGPKRMGIALFNHYLILVKAKKADVYEPKFWFPVREFTVEDLPDTPSSSSYPWLLRSEKNTFEFSAVSEAEKEIWMDCMIDSIEDATLHHDLSFQDPSKYMIERLFVSSLDLTSRRSGPEDRTDIDLDHLHIPLPSGSTSFSQSAIFNKPAKNSHRLSIPNFSTFFYPPGEGLRSPSSSRFFSRGTLTEKLSNYRSKHFKSRCETFDANFKDVYATSLITAKGSHRKRGSQ
ncbi:unnamed protein product [Rhizopus stolonifer]